MPPLFREGGHQVGRMKGPVSHHHDLRFVGKRLGERFKEGPSLESRTDWERLHQMTAEQVEEAARSDPNAVLFERCASKQDGVAGRRDRERRIL